MEFHVTVMSLDSINEGSMVSHLYKINLKMMKMMLMMMMMMMMMAMMMMIMLLI